SGRKKDDRAELNYLSQDQSGVVFGKTNPTHPWSGLSCSTVKEFFGKGGSKHEVPVLKPEHHAAPAAADVLVLIGNMLTPGRDVRQKPAERQVVREAGSAAGFEDARGEQRAALGDLGRLEFVAQALFERRHLAGLGVSVQILQIAMQRVRHLVDS